MNYRIKLHEVYENSDGCEVQVTLWTSTTDDVKVAQMMFAHECGACAPVDAVELERWLHAPEPARFNLHSREIILYACEYDWAWDNEDRLTMMGMSTVWTCDRLSTR